MELSTFTQMSWWLSQDLNSDFVVPGLIRAFQPLTSELTLPSILFSPKLLTLSQALLIPKRCCSVFTIVHSPVGGNASSHTRIRAGLVLVGVFLKHCKETFSNLTS